MPRAPAILLLASALAWGCAGPPRLVEDDGPPIDVASDPYAAFVNVEPPRQVRPISARLTLRRPAPPDLAAFLDRFTASVEAGRWAAVAFYLEEEGVRGEMASLTARGMSPHEAAEHVLVSTLGLADGNLAPAGAPPFAGVARISTITVDTAHPDGAAATRVEGYLRLDDRSTPRFAFSVRLTPQGIRVIVPQL